MVKRNKMKNGRFIINLDTSEVIDGATPAPGSGVVHSIVGENSQGPEWRVDVRIQTGSPTSGLRFTVIGRNGQAVALPARYQPLMTVYAWTMTGVAGQLYRYKFEQPQALP